MEWVFDASVGMTWCFDDEGSGHTQDLFDRLKVSPAVVPAVWLLEVANVLMLALRHGRITPAKRTQFLETIESLPIHVDVLDSPRAFGAVLPIAEAHKLTAYDAAYLEVAMRLGVPLATLDTDLRAAAKKAGVTLL